MEFSICAGNAKIDGCDEFWFYSRGKDYLGDG
jgi:hypothetical protein